MESNTPAASSPEPSQGASSAAAPYADASNGSASLASDAMQPEMTPGEATPTPEAASQEQEPAPEPATPEMAVAEAQPEPAEAEPEPAEPMATPEVVAVAEPVAELAEAEPSEPIAAPEVVAVAEPVAELAEAAEPAEAVATLESAEEAVAADAPAGPAEVELPEAAPADSMQALLEAQPDEPRIKKGDILEGVIVQTTPTEILIDLGLKSEGVVSGKELERMDRDMLETLKVGEKVLAFVLIPENKSGHIVLSLTRALEEQDWRTAEAMRQSQEVYQGKVDGYNKGGLIVRFGRVRGFVPESQASRERRLRAAGADPQEKWGGMRGEDIAVKVVEVDRARNRLILSEREAAPQLREQRKERLLGELNVGDVRVGKVKSLADFGAFVDVGGADGLVHLTELSWKHVTHPRDVLKVGQEVEVEVISVDRERKRIGLSIKRREEDPWMVIARQYQPGQLVQGTITKLTKFGAFARLVDNPEIEGLIHISELAPHRVNHPRDVVNEGDVLTLRVVKIDAQQRRLGLSLKRVNSPDYLDADIRRAMEPAESPSGAAAPMGDLVDFEAASLKEDERRRNDRKKGKRGKKGKTGEFDEFDEVDDDDEDEY